MDTNAERQARWRARQKARAEEQLTQAQARIAELENELRQAQIASQAKTRNAALENELKQAQARIAALESELKRAQATPSDSEVARLKKANKELRTKISYLTRWHEREMESKGKMPLATYRAIAKCLHPDHKPSEEERENAIRLFNNFRSSQK